MQRWTALGAVLALLGAVFSCATDADSTHGDAGASPDGVPAGDGGADPSGGCGVGRGLCEGVCGPVSQGDDRCGAGSCAKPCTAGQHCAGGVCQASKIEHVVVIVQENHAFDGYFGAYCTAPSGSSPTCTTGRACCEAAPATEPHGGAPRTLDDDANFSKDRNHEQACELQQINGGAMDQFVTGSTGASTCYGVGPSCANPENWSLASGSQPTEPLYAYWSLADTYALADRYFQPIAGGSASNDMYFAGAHFRFRDNQRMPDVAVGTDFANKRSVNPGGLCDDAPACIGAQRITYGMDNIATLLLDANKTFGIYADGYDHARAAATGTQSCAAPSDALECPYRDCLSHPVACFGCLYDPSDIPFLYYRRFADSVAGDVRNPTPFIQDYASLQTDVARQTLPAFSFVKARLFHNEHPNLSKLSDGAGFVKSTVDIILSSSSYAVNTLILVTWDEGGGFFDHVAPPPAPPTSVDADETGNPVPYGTRVPFLVIGAFAKRGAVSHVVMEHSSIVKFLEWNFLTGVGQLQARDGWVANIGSMLDPSATGIAVPEK